MTLESLTLKNFQKHKALYLQFDPHVTTIVGDNEVGKTTVLRAIRWVCFNDPSGGTDIFRWGTEKALARIEIAGKSIERMRF